MAEKKMRGRLFYLPARISQKKDRWEIVYYQTNPTTGQRRRHRETWDLNRIHDLKARKKEALRIILQINSWLPHGYPYNTPDDVAKKLEVPPLARAIELAISDKVKSDKEESRKTYRSIGGGFLTWLKKQDLSDLHPGNFSRRLALEFLDHVGERRTRLGKQIGARTWNNYLGITSALFGVLEAREYIKKNPFAEIKRKPVADKARRRFQPVERAAVAGWLYRRDYFAFLACIMQYHCLFRGTELRRLRRQDFLIDRGLIRLIGEKSKTGKERWVTITPELSRVLADSRFLDIPPNFLIFGYLGRPNPSRAMGRGHVWRRMREGLLTLHRAGNLDDIEGLSPYGMKDTGITEYLQHVPLPEVMRQAGHSSANTTMLYYQPDVVSPAFAGSDASIFEARKSRPPAGAGAISEQTGEK